MKVCTLIALFFISNAGFACVCVSNTLLNDFQHSDFVAKVKVLKVSEATADGEFQDATIEVLELYKGNKITTSVLILLEDIQLVTILLFEILLYWV